MAIGGQSLVPFLGFFLTRASVSPGLEVKSDEVRNTFSALGVSKSELKPHG